MKEEEPTFSQLCAIIIKAIIVICRLARSRVIAAADLAFRFAVHS
jgi:hypothetical protein